MKRIALAAAACLIFTPTALADIGVRLNRTSARPGDVVVAKSWPLQLPLYLVPSALVPHSYSCRDGTAVCAPTSLGPPRRRGWTLVGAFTRRRDTVRFRVPDLAPGSYRAVVYCAPCVRGVRGSLLAGSTIRILSR